MDISPLPFIMSVDNVTVMAPTQGALQILLNIRASYCSKFCFKFNVGKTLIMVFGKLPFLMAPFFLLSAYNLKLTAYAYTVFKSD